MSWNEDIDLGNITDAGTTTGGEQSAPVEFNTTICANLLSIKSSEFYQASLAGLKPELAFEIHDFEYDPATAKKVRYPAGNNGKEYFIIRTFYPNKNRNREIVVSSYPGSETA